MTELIQRRTLLSQNILSFGRYLRQKQPFRIDAHSLSDALQATAEIPLGDPNSFRETLKTSLCQTKAEWLLFDDYYHTYWRELEKALDSKLKNGDLGKSHHGKLKSYSIQDIKSWLYANQETNKDSMVEAAMTSWHSSDETTNISIEVGLQEIKVLVRSWHEKLRMRNSRRRKDDNRKGILDLRKVISATVKGKEFKLTYRTPKLKEVNLVVLFDTSKSMSMYQSFYCTLIKTLFDQFKRVYTYGFNTELIPTNSTFSKLSLDRTIAALEDIRGLYTSGTKIGICLEQYLESHSPEQVNSRTIILIISDGWDTGDAIRLAKVVEKLQYKSLLLTWFNPVYKVGQNDLPLGMQAAAPYIDDLVSVYSQDTFQQFVQHQ